MWISDETLKNEMHQILYLQTKLHPYESVLAAISQCLSPHIIFQYIAPLICALTGEPVGNTLVTLASVEYLHLLMKWVLRENRPFWWIKETKVYTDLTRPSFRQHELTCETTAGNPSAHTAILTVLLCINGQKFIRYLESRTNCNRHVIKYCVYTAVSCCVVIMWCTRMYFGSHFLHQCVSGTILGLFVLRFFNKERNGEEILNKSKKVTFGIAFLLMIIAGGLYLAMLKIDDPLWSVRMAFKWCENVTYLAHETTPVYGIVKNLGAILGLAASSSRTDPTLKEDKQKKSSWKHVLVTILSLSANFAIFLNTPKTMGRGIFLFYVFSASAFHTYTLVRIVPKISALV